MTESQNNNELKIIKARVEQDKYAAVELKIIKANNTSVLKDLYVEKELENGSLFVASDNVLVTLHRTLKSGMVPNFELITKEGEVLLKPEYKEIRPIDNNMFIAVRAVPEMTSVKNNQALKNDVSKVQEVAQDVKNIKEQMISTMRTTNPMSQGTLNFLCEDAYDEVELYRLVKNNGKYIAQVIADKISFVATDGVYMYTHSNVVSELTKSEKIDNSISQESEKKVMETPPAINSFSSYERPTLKEEVVPDASERVDSIVSSSPISNNLSSSISPVTKSNLNTEATSANDDMSNIVSSVDIGPIHSVSIDDMVPAYNEKSIIDSFDKKDNIIEEKASYADDLFDTSSIMTSEMSIDGSDDSDTSGNTNAFDEFFGISNDSVSRDIDISYDSHSSHNENDRYEQLSDMISKVISEEKSAKAKILNYEEKIRELESKMTKATAEIESKTKKVNILINQNRQLGDDNRTLKNRVSGLENKTARLEEENKKYMAENERLRLEAKNRENKLSAMISSVSELLGSYRDVDSNYSVKRKVA